MTVMWKPPLTSFAALTAINTAPMEAFWNELTQDEPKTSFNASRNDATDIYHLTRVRLRCTSLALEMRIGSHPASSRDHPATAIVLDIGFPQVNRTLRAVFVSASWRMGKCWYGSQGFLATSMVGVLES